MKYLPSKSALLHSRFLFSVFLMPVYVFALSQVPYIDLLKALIVFMVWHIFIYPASNGYNSYFDKDEGSIALLEKPPAVDKSLYLFSLFLDMAGILFAITVSYEFALAAFTYGLLSKMYSHPYIRLKKYPIASFLTVFIFQGWFVYISTYTAISNLSVFDIGELPLLAGLICSFLIGASYPLTQVYQHKEDRKRGDKTLSIILGVNGSFLFAALLFVSATLLMYHYWSSKHTLNYFYWFLLFILPVMAVFVKWVLRILTDQSEANYRNMSKMTYVSGIAMLLYFTFILFQTKF